MSPPNTSIISPRTDSSSSILAQAFMGLPVDHLVDVVVAQCQQLQRGSQLEDIATLLEAVFASQRLDQNALDKLYASFLAGYQRLEIVDLTAKSIGESILSLFLANNDQLLSTFLDRLSETVTSHLGDNGDNDLSTTAPPTFIQDASDALALGQRLVPSLNSTAVSTAFLSHAVSGLSSFDRDIRAAAIKLLPVVIQSLQSLGKWTPAELDRVYALLATLRSSPVLLPDFAQLLSILLPIALSPTPADGLIRIITDTSLLQGLVASLKLAEPSSRKFAIHCLHQIVDAIQVLPPKSYADLVSRCNASSLFPLCASLSHFTSAWNDFFLTYDLVAESYQHLLKTCFPLLTRNLAASSITEATATTTLPTEWWLAVLERGFINDSLASRKMVLNYILSASDPAVVQALISHRAFLESLVAACEPAVLYQVNVQGAFVSPFGESIARFWSRAVVADRDLVAFLVNKLSTTRAHVWLVFGVYGLAQAAREGNLVLAEGESAVQSVLQLVQNTSPISNNSRRLIEQLVLDVVLLAKNANEYAVDTVFLVCSYLSYFDHPQLGPWIQAHNPADALVHRMRDLTSTPRALSMAVRESKSLAFIYRALADVKSKSRARESIKAVINQVYTHPYLAQGIPEQRTALAMALDDELVTAAVGANVASYLMMQLDRVASTEWLEFYLDMVPVFARYADQGLVGAEVRRVLASDKDDGSIEVQLAKVLAMRLAEYVCGTGQAGVGISTEMIQSASISRPASAQVHWNDLVTRFVTLKWNCLVLLVNSSSDFLTDLTDQLLDELESDHREGSVPLIRAAARLISPADASRFARALGISWSMVVETTSVPKHFNVLYPAFLDLLLAPKYLREDSLQPVIEAYMCKVIDIGSTKFSVVSMAAERMYQTLDDNAELGFRYRETLVKWIMYGPARDRDEERLETVWLRKLGSEIGANTDYSVRVLGAALAAQLATHTEYGPALYSLLMQTFFSPALNPSLEFPNQQPNRAKLRLLSVILIMTPYAVTPTTALDYFTSVLRIFDGEPSSNIRPYCEWLLALLALHNLDAILPRVFDALQQYNGRPVKITSVLFVAAYLVRALHNWSPVLGSHSDTRLPPPTTTTAPATTGYATSIPTVAVAHAHLLDLVQSIFRSVTCWLASNHFTIRLHTQWLLERAWTVCLSLAAESASPAWHALTSNPAHQSLHACLTTNKDCVKFKAKYLEPGYMTNDFDALQDLSIEFVFHLLPRIVPDNAPDEYVSSRAFARVRDVMERVAPLVAEGRHMLLKHEHVEDLVNDPAGRDFVAEQVTGVVTAAPAGERIRASEEPIGGGGGAAGNNAGSSKGKGGGRGARSKNNSEPACVKAAAAQEMPKIGPFPDVIATTLAPALPVQRKINPWAAMLQADVTTSADAQAPADSTSRLAAMQAAIRTLGPRGRLDLVVCASLVELNTNLGGLARTCEIFGLRGLTVHSSNILTDPLFRTLAVSADRHLPIEQVARGEPLVDWLRAMKRKHYVIVALEQTSASVSLEKVARFPEKMVLLLGKEKEGVPGELLAEVDMCIEIPQLGVTRSLNVHNAACTICWEYVRRRLVD